ncbi:MAG: ATP-dependent DNA helicase, partial [Pyrinomonadaceae bacterium]
SMLSTEAEITRRARHASHAREAVNFATDNAMEREAVADMRKVTADALRRGMALTTYEAIQGELKARHEKGELVIFRRENKQNLREATTTRMLNLEYGNLRSMLESRGQTRQMFELERAREVISMVSAGQGVVLNAEQNRVIEQILTSRDRITGLQGKAGTGKTTTLATLNQAAMRAGYVVKGLATTTGAAKRLAESGINTMTLQKFLVQKQPEERKVGTMGGNESQKLYVVDESSLASTRAIDRFFARVNSHDKVLLVGDTGQHQGVEAGSPFEQLQKHGMATTVLSEVVRQRDPKLKEVVRKLSAREVREAVMDLHAQGRVIEIRDEGQRLRSIADEYCREPQKTLVISPANQERVAINTMIQQQLQAAGVVSRENHAATIYVNRQDMTGTERTFANAYIAGEDVIRYVSASKVHGIKAGDYGQVTGTNHKENLLSVKLPDGRVIEYNPKRLYGVSVYKEAQRVFAEGDRLQIRAPFNEQRVTNGELGRIMRIEGENFSVKLDAGRLDTGREVRFSLSEFRHIDHGYGVTSYSSQGQTVERVIINADTRESELLLNRRMAYVAVSRAREDARIFTNSIEKLGEALDRQVDKLIAHETIRQAGWFGHGQEQGQEAGSTLSARQGRTLERMARVSRKHPCPVCSHSTWCLATPDDSRAICMRQASDRPLKNNGYLHVLFEHEDQPCKPVPTGVRTPIVEIASPLASIEKRNHIYSRLQEALSLNERERSNLKTRGLDDETIRRNG